MFLDSNDLSERHYTMENYREWAGEIANSYLKAGALPTNTLVKIAQAEDLTPHQIETLAGEANQAIHQAKYAGVEEKYFAADFPLADSKSVIKQLQLDGGETKVAAAMPEPVVPDEGPTPEEMFGVPIEEMDKTAEVKHDAKTAHEKLASLKSRIQDKITLTNEEYLQNTHSFIKQARNEMLSQGSSAERMKTLGQLTHFVKCADMQNTGHKVLAKLAHVLMEEGKLEPAEAKVAINYFMSKEADVKAPESLISKNLPAQIVNGEHPLYITLKTIRDNEADILRFKERGLLVDDKLKMLNQKIRAL